MLFTIHVDIEVEFFIKSYNESDDVVYEHSEIVTIPKIYLGKFPINASIRYVYIKKPLSRSKI